MKKETRFLFFNANKSSTSAFSVKIDTAPSSSGIRLFRKLKKFMRLQ